MFWSGDLETMLGIEGSTLEGRSLWDVLALRPSEALLAAWELACHGQPQEFPEELGVGSGCALCGLSFLPWVEGPGEPRGVLVSIRRRLSPDALGSRLREVERLAHMAQSVVGFVHDLNNVFTVLQTYASLVDLESDVVLNHEDWSTILRSVRHGHALTTGLLSTTIGDPADEARGVVDLNQFVSETSGLLSRLVGAGIILGIELAEGELPVEVGPGQLDRILLNLALNARDAMQGRGQLVVGTEWGSLPPAEPNVGTAQPRPCAVLRVSDNGPGIASAVRSHLFEPFVSTKPPGNGNGIGLSSVAETTRRLGGSVEARNVDHSGAEFRVSIPLASRAARESAGWPLL